MPLPGNRVGAIRCQQVNWNNGPEPVADTKFILPADMALLAMGFTGAEKNLLLEEFDIELNQFERLPIDEGHCLKKGIYACGDAAQGPSLVVRAINNGLNAARAILAQM